MSEKLQRLLDSAKKVVLEKSMERINGKVSSSRTQEIAEQVIANCCRRLHAKGFYIENVESLSKKHIDALVQDWYHGDKLSVKTIQNQFSRLKIFCGWIGKKGIVSPQGAIGHLPGVDIKLLKVNTVADKSKSWSANGVDIGEKIRQADANDHRHAVMLMMAVAFSLRKKEQLRIVPWKADKGNILELDGSIAKNGKYRAIAFERGTPEMDQFGQAQRWALNEAKKICKKNEPLGWPGLTFRQSENRYSYQMRVLGLTKFDEGVTAHGLRAEFAENMLILRGLMPPSLGGTAAQMPKAERDVILQDAANKLGHNDLHTSSAYFATFRKSYTKGNLGGKVGRVIVVDSKRDHFAVLYANPMPKAGADGSYKTVSPSARANTVITLVLETPGSEDANWGLQDFVKAHPHVAERIKSQLSAVGLGE